MLALLVLASAVATASPLDVTPQLCLNGSAGGLDCLCTTSLTNMALSRCEVDCSSRNISSLPSNWQISQLVSKLDLSRNKLSSLSNEQFSHWGNLEELSLARNLFKTLNEDVFLGLANLRVLDLSHNSLSTLPDKIFNGLPILSILNLEMNSLQNLDPNLFSLTPHLESLTLSYNRDLGKYLMSSPRFLSVAIERNLSSLTLNSMGITSIPNKLFSSAVNLRHLSLSDNPVRFINSLPASLESLNLSGIDIEILMPGNFINYPKLKKLHLDRLLSLKEVQQNAFEGLTSLGTLTMDNCIQLQEFNSFAFGGYNSSIVPLRRLSLARGGLRSIGQDVYFTLNKTLLHLNLEGNPWHCDCKLSWLLQVHSVLDKTDYLRCFFPEELHNKLVLSLDEDKFTCTEEVAHSGPVIVIILDVFIILIVLVACTAVLIFLWRRGFVCFRPRLEVGKYAHVSVEPNRAELEWDDKDLDHIWSTPSVKDIHKGP